MKISCSRHRDTISASIFLLTFLPFITTSRLAETFNNATTGNASFPPNSTDLFSAEIEKQLNVSLSSVLSLIPISNMSYTPATFITSNLSQLSFLNNGTAMEDAFQQQFIQADQNKDGFWELDDIKRFLRQQAGSMRYLLMQWTDSLDDIIDKDFQRIDTDHSGNISFTEFNASMTQIFMLPLKLPTSYRVICDAVEARWDTCSSRVNTTDSFSSDTLIAQMQLCRSGYSWIVNQFEIEKCILEQSDSDAKCHESMKKCLPASNLPKFSPLAEGSENSLQKRSLLLTAPLSTSAAAMLTNAFIVIPSLVIGSVVALIAVFIGAFFGAAAISSNKHSDQYWHQIQNFERWMIGMQEPPCDTPFVFWNPSCGALGSKHARTCVRGQPHTTNGCKWWWSGASQTCNVVGCRLLCMDVSRFGCAEGSSRVELGYDENGRGIVKK